MTESAATLQLPRFGHPIAFPAVLAAQTHEAVAGGRLVVCDAAMQVSTPTGRVYGRVEIDE
jgi:hypothetical protein